MQKWLGKMPEAVICIVLLSPSYFQSGPCKEEIYQTAREGIVILPVIFETPPQLKRGYFGASEDEREKGNFVKAKIGNWLPTPDQGLFQDNWSDNLARLLEQVKKHVSSDSIGPVEHGMAALSVESTQTPASKSTKTDPQDPPKTATTPIAKVSEGQITAFYEKVGSSSDEVRTATQLDWNHKGLNDEDCKVMAYIFSVSGALPTLEILSLHSNRIGDAGLTSLSGVLASGALPTLAILSLASNRIGDAGLTSLSGVLASGALAQLTHLGLTGNRIGDVGLKSFSDALASGALANLKDIYVDVKHMDHPQLKQACNRRNITIR